MNFLVHIVLPHSCFSFSHLVLPPPIPRVPHPPVSPALLRLSQEKSSPILIYLSVFLLFMHILFRYLPFFSIFFLHPPVSLPPYEMSDKHSAAALSDSPLLHKHTRTHTDALTELDLLPLSFSPTFLCILAT